MPLVPGKSKSAFEKNIAIERKAGKPEKQAVAIAYSKRGEDAEEFAVGDKVKVVATPAAGMEGTIVSKSGDNWRVKFANGDIGSFAARSIAVRAKDNSMGPLPTPAEKKLALAKHAAGITKSQDNDGPFYKGEAVKRSSGETGTVVEQKGGRVIVVPDRLKSTTESWEVGKTSLLHKAKDKWSSAEEQKYFDLRKKHQAKLEAKNPGESSNRLRAHESAMKEMGEKVAPYALGKDDDLKKLRDARAKALDMEPIPVPGKDSEVPIGFAAGKSPEFRRAEWERRQAELREANARERAERRKKAKDEEPKANARNDGHLASIKKHWNSKIYAHYASIYNAEGKAAADKYLQQFTTRKVEDSAQISGSEPQDHLARANQYEIAGDRARALDSYRAAASGYRRLGNHQGEDSARDGIVECQRRLVGGHEGLYDHPSKGKHQAFDSADRALTSALQRTRAGESVRITDSGFEVIPAGTKRAKDERSVGSMKSELAELEATLRAVKNPDHPQHGGNTREIREKIKDLKYKLERAK